VRDASAPAHEAFWISGILAHVPVSFSILTDVALQPDAEKDKISPETDVWAHLGGSIKDRIGYFAHDVTSSSGEVLGVFRSPGRVPVNVRWGRMTPETVLWKDNQGTTVTPLAVNAFAVTGGGGPLSTPRDGLELDLFGGSRVRLAAGVADRKHQNDMDYYGQLTGKVGGTDLRGREPEIDMDVESVWDFLTITLNGYGYFGTVDKGSYKTRYYRAGLDAELQWKRLTVLVSGLTAQDRDVDEGGLEVDSAVYLAEADYFADPVLLTARYEHEDVGNADQGVTNRFIGGVTWVPIEAFEFKAEGRYSLYGKGDDESDFTGIIRVELHL